MLAGREQTSWRIAWVKWTIVKHDQQAYRFVQLGPDHNNERKKWRSNGKITKGARLFSGPERRRWRRVVMREFQENKDEPQVSWN
jgi:hypothetical protein